MVAVCQRGRTGPRTLAEGGHGLPRGLGGQLGVARGRRVGLALLAQLQRTPHERAALLLQDRNLAERALHGEILWVAGVHAAAEGLDEALEHFGAQVAGDELLDALLSSGGRRGLEEAHRAEAGADFAGE